MSLLSSNLYSIEQGECNWRAIININLSMVYTNTEVTSIVDSKADVVHTHSEYFPLPTLATSTDLLPTISGMLTDLQFDSTFSVYLVDRSSRELFKIVIDSGVISVTATGEFAGVSPNSLDVNSSNMIAVYDTTINGEII